MWLRATLFRACKQTAKSELTTIRQMQMNETGMVRAKQENSKA